MGSGKSWKSFLILEIVFPQRGNILVLPLREILEILEIFILCHRMGSGESWKFFFNLGNRIPASGNILISRFARSWKSWKSLFSVIGWARANLGNFFSILEIVIPASGNILVLPLREILEILEIFIFCHWMGSGKSWKSFFNLGNRIPASGNCVRLESLRFVFVFSLKLKD
jgi:hypothetical protein